MIRQNKKPSTFILILLISYAAVSAVLFTPAMPRLITAMNTTNGEIQLTVTLFLLGYAFGQLIYGPLANGFGRKIALYFGLVLALLGEGLSLFAATHNHIILLLIARLVTAIGASSGYTLTFIIINDSYALTQARRVLATAILSFAIAPGVSIALGGYLTDHLGWQSCFYAMLLYGIVLLILSPLLPETAKNSHLAYLKPKKILQDYLSFFHNRRFLLYASCGSLWAAFLYLYYAKAPFIASSAFHLSSTHYGVISLLTSFGYFLGNIIARSLARNKSAIQVINYGLMALLLGTALLGIDVFEPHHWALLFFIAIAICFVGGAMLVSNVIALGLNKLDNVAMGSSMFGCLNMVGPITSVAILSLAGSAQLTTFFFAYVALFCMLAVLNKLASKKTILSKAH